MNHLPTACSMILKLHHELLQAPRSSHKSLISASEQARIQIMSTRTESGRDYHIREKWSSKQNLPTAKTFGCVPHSHLETGELSHERLVTHMERVRDRKLEGREKETHRRRVMIGGDFKMERIVGQIKGQRAAWKGLREEDSEQER